MGTKPQDAYFVKCNRITMTQKDVDGGKLIVQVGVAAVRPAEFMIFSVSHQLGKL